jgi:uncharacterized DUF497 family protein
MPSIDVRLVLNLKVLQMEFVGIEYDEIKRLKILEERGIDLADATSVLQGDYVEQADDREDYGELRFRVWGFLHGKRISLVWTPRGPLHRIITMRHAHESEHEARKRTLD